MENQGDTDEELVMSDDDLIISKTDSKGIIIYVNRDFIRFSGFDEAKILGQSHTTLLHPDMPWAIFKLMRQNLHAGKEFFGFIKNISKNDHFYWTYANISPSYDINGNVIGHFSVERKAYPSAINYFADIYQNMLKKELQNNGENKSEVMDSSKEVLFEAIKKAGGDGYDEFMFSG